MIIAPIIITDRLFLRQIEFGDARETAALMSPQISAHAPGWPAVLSVDEAITRISESRDAANAGRWVDWGIFIKEDLHLIGWIGMGRISETQNRTKIAGWIGEAFTRNNYGTEAVTAITTKGADYFGAASISANVSTTNYAAIGLLKKLGFSEKIPSFRGNLVLAQPYQDMCFQLDLEEWSASECQSSTFPLIVSG